MLKKSVLWLLAILMVASLAGCGQAEPTAAPVQPTAVPPTATVQQQAAAPTATSVPPTATAVPPTATAAAPSVYKIGMNAEYPPFEFVDAAGKISGFDVDLLEALSKKMGFQYELVNTRWDGIFVALQSGEFDAVCSAATITDERAQIVNFSDPYFNAGQTIAVRAADKDTLNTVAALEGKKVGVQLGTTGDIWLTENSKAQVVRFDEVTLAFQSLANKDLDAVFNDGPVSAEIIRANPEMGVLLVGDPITDEFYGIAVNKARTELLKLLNDGLAAIRADGTYDAIYDKYFGMPEVAAPAKDTLIIGTTDKATVLDPADSYDFFTWELHHNTADTLLHYIPGTTDLEPGLAAEMPAVSADGLQYTVKLLQGLKFKDGSPLNAEAVKWSIDRVMKLEGDPNWLVTSFVEKVEVVDEYTVKFVLLAPVNYFPLLLATPPYTPLSPTCYSADKFDADSTCGGVGPYTIASWTRDVELVLEANPVYPVQPKTAKIIVKFFADSTTLRLAAESGEVDIATKTLNPTDYADLEAAGKLQVIEGPGAQIRYLCFNNTTPPFDAKEIRQAIAAAADRDAIATVAYQGTHDPLYSMVPMGMWSHIDAFGKRDLAKSKELLTAAGYSATNKLKMDLWWTPTHYGPTEADVATILKDNLEETGLIEVTLQNTEWATYKEYMSAGSMPVFLLGWYPDYLDPDNYTWPFAHSTASDDQGIYYANPEMDALMEAGQTAKELRGADRLKTFDDIQKLWAVESPTIPLTQGTLLVVAQPNIDGIILDPNMMFHYFTLYAK